MKAILLYYAVNYIKLSGQFLSAFDKMTEKRL